MAVKFKLSRLYLLRLACITTHDSVRFRRLLPLGALLDPECFPVASETTLVQEHPFSLQRISYLQRRPLRMRKFHSPQTDAQRIKVGIGQTQKNQENG